jgi:hypothetical protein
MQYLADISIRKQDHIISGPYLWCQKQTALHKPIKAFWLLAFFSYFVNYSIRKEVDDIRVSDSWSQENCAQNEILTFLFWNVYIYGYFNFRLYENIPKKAVRPPIPITHLQHLQRPPILSMPLQPMHISSSQLRGRPAKRGSGCMRLLSYLASSDTWDWLLLVFLQWTTFFVVH